MNWVDLIDVVFILLVAFSLFRYARAQQQKRRDKQMQNEAAD
jgi:hypothetical protein